MVKKFGHSESRSYYNSIQSVKDFKIKNDERLRKAITDARYVYRTCENKALIEFALVENDVCLNLLDAKWFFMCFHEAIVNDS